MATNIQQMDDEPGLGGRVIDAYGGRSLHAQSHGESFLALLMNRFGPNGPYLLDEPEGGAVTAAATGGALAPAWSGAGGKPVRDRHALAHPDGLSRRVDLPM